MTTALTFQAFAVANGPQLIAAAAAGALLAAGFVWMLMRQRQAEQRAALQQAERDAGERRAEELARQDKADETRRQLLADVSHELATPLTSIRGSAETLLDANVPLDDNERAALVGDILAAARRMNVLIEDLFDLTRLESRVSDLHVERIDWAALCGHLVARYQARFEELGLRLSFVGPEEPAFVDADGRRLEQILENLLGNALRYVTAPGRVKVILQTVPGQVHRLRVVDDGPGFPASDLSRLFDRFYKSDRDRSSPGSGLGLAIVKELVERHGGRVEAGNRDPLRGSGAVVTIELDAV